MPVLIGTLLGGRTPSNSEVVSAIEALSRRADTVSEKYEGPAALEFLFQVPGPFLQPDFEGIRVGSYRQSDQRLQVQIAVRPEVDEFSAEAFIKGALKDASTAAFEYLAPRVSAEALTPIRLIVDELLGSTSERVDLGDY